MWPLGKGIGDPWRMEGCNCDSDRKTCMWVKEDVGGIHDIVD